MRSPRSAIDGSPGIAGHGSIDDTREATVDLLVPSYRARLRSSVRHGSTNTTEVGGLDVALKRPVVRIVETVTLTDDVVLDLDLDLDLLIPDAASMLEPGFAVWFARSAAESKPDPTRDPHPHGLVRIRTRRKPLLDSTPPFRSRGVRVQIPPRACALNRQDVIRVGGEVGRNVRRRPRPRGSTAERLRWQECKESVAGHPGADSGAQLGKMYVTSSNELTPNTYSSLRTSGPVFPTACTELGGTKIVLPAQMSCRTPSIDTTPVPARM